MVTLLNLAILLASWQTDCLVREKESKGNCEKTTVLALGETFTNIADKRECWIGVLVPIRQRKEERRAF